MLTEDRGLQLPLFCMVLSCLPARSFSGVGCAGFFPSASRIFSLSVYSLPFFSVHGLAVGNSYVYDI